jgi:hypothetical protein
LTAVLAGQSLLHLGTGVLRWSAILTGFWAVLYVIICIDPGVRDKIETAQSLARTLSEVQGIGPRDKRG